MTAWIACAALAAVMAYLCGAIPTGYWLGRLLRGIDIRKHGSRSTGATNVLRTLGKAPALAALLIDLVKGVAAVTLVRWLYAQTMVIALAPPALDPGIWLPWASVAAALLAILGHSRSVFIGFTGGKSAATGLGVLLAISWPVGLGAALCFLGMLALSRIVSLSSIVAAGATVALMLLLGQPLAYLLMAVAGAGYVVFLHRANIRRLLAGTEPRIGRPIAAPH